MKQACRIGMSRRVFFFRGVAVAECRAPRLSTDDSASWGEVCERANRTAQTFFDEAETVLLPLAAEAYDADPDPRKRFGGVRARLSVSCRAYAADGLLSLGWRAELYRRDAPASSVAWGETYLPGGCPLSLRLYLGERAFRALARRCRVPRRRLAAAGWCVSETGLRVYAAGREIEAPLPDPPSVPAGLIETAARLAKPTKKAESASDPPQKRPKKKEKTACIRRLSARRGGRRGRARMTVGGSGGGGGRRFFRALYDNFVL